MLRIVVFAWQPWKGLVAFYVGGDISYVDWGKQMGGAKKAYFEIIW